MNKETKYIVFIIIALVLASLVYFLVTNKRAEVVIAPVDTNAEMNTESVPAIVEAPEVVVPVEDPVYTKTIAIEFMNSADKKKIGLDDSLKVQVLDRAEDGTVLAYRIITEATPVIDKFGN